MGELAGLLVLFFTPFFVFFVRVLASWVYPRAPGRSPSLSVLLLLRASLWSGDRLLSAARSKEPSTSHVPVARRAQCFPSAAWASNALDTRAEGLSCHPKN